MKPRDQWGPADEFFDAIMTGMSMAGVLIVVLIISWLAFSFVASHFLGW